MVRAPDRCMGGHGLDFRWYSLFLFSHARNKVVVVGGTGGREPGRVGGGRGTGGGRVKGGRWEFQEGGKREK